MFETYKTEIEENLKKLFDEYSKDRSFSQSLWESMSYTPLLSGKRLRAIIALETGRLLNAKKEHIMPFALALEIMHAYSLIHDDLPCMDNDTLRRGKPTNHVLFGEAQALLAGDALISFGAEILIEKLSDKLDKALVLDLVHDYLLTSGARGIIAGQIADINAQKNKNNYNIEYLKYIHNYKTAALFKLAFIGAAKIANADFNIIEKLGEYAQNFGLLFQIYDDIIDATLTTEEIGKTAGKDKADNKLTYVNFLGLNEAKNIFYSLIDKNYDILNSIGCSSKIFDDIYAGLQKKVEKK